MRTAYGRYKEYHTSADNKDFISFEALEQSVAKYLEIVSVLERNDFYVNKMPYGEPQLGRRGLYETLGAQTKTSERKNALLWLLSEADGTKDLIHTALKSKVRFAALADAADALLRHGIIAKVPGPGLAPSAVLTRAGKS